MAEPNIPPKYDYLLEKYLTRFPYLIIGPKIIYSVCISKQEIGGEFFIVLVIKPKGLIMR